MKLKYKKIIYLIFFFQILTAFSMDTERNMHSVDLIKLLSSIAGSNNYKNFGNCEFTSGNSQPQTCSLYLTASMHESQSDKFLKQDIRTQDSTAEFLIHNNPEFRTQYESKLNQFIELLKHINLSFVKNNRIDSINIMKFRLGLPKLMGFIPGLVRESFNNFNGSTCINLFRF